MRINLIYLLLFFCPFFTLSQKYAYSPLSSQGYGDPNPLNHGYFGAVGNTAYALADSTELNFLNPSTYSFLSKGQPLFSLGLSSQFSNFSQSNATSKNNLFALNYLAFGLSFSKNLGMCVGIKPFASTGYELNTNYYSASDTLSLKLNGFGGFSNSFLGLAYKFRFLDKHFLSFGYQFNYVFGQNLNEEISTLPSAISGGVRQKALKIKSVMHDFGLTYKLVFNKSSNLIVGSSFTPKQNLSSTFTNTFSFASDISNVLSQDTLDNEIQNGNTTIPTAFNVGFRYDYIAFNKLNRNKTNVYQLQMMGDVKWRQWSEFRSLSSTSSFENTISYSGGIQFSPHYDFLDRASVIKFYSKLKYRFGAYYENLPWTMNNSKFVNKGFTLGLGIPIASQRSLSSINISCLIGSRTNNSSDALKEKYVSINFGVNIAPAIYDRWFRKGKID